MKGSSHYPGSQKEIYIADSSQVILILLNTDYIKSWALTGLALTGSSHYPRSRQSLYSAKADISIVQHQVQSVFSAVQLKGHLTLISGQGGDQDTSVITAQLAEILQHNH